MSLSTASLTVGENSSVIAANDGFYERKSCLVINGSLGRVGAVNGVVGKNFLRWAPFLVWSHNHLVRLLVNIANALAA